MKKLLLPFSFLLLPFSFLTSASAWDYSKFDPGNPAASGFQMVWNDEFSSISTIDINQTRANGYKWYYCIFDSSGCGAPPAGMFTIVTEGGETFLRINSTWDTTEVLTSGRSPSQGQAFVGAKFGGGWFVEYETKFDPTKVMVPYNPNNELCFPVPPAQYVYSAPAITGATWSSANGGQATFTFTSDYPLVAQQGINISGVTPDGYNGWYNVFATGPGYAVVTKVSDPGAYVSGGTINGWGNGGSLAGFANNKGCGCVPGSQTQGCAGWPGIWAQSSSWVDYTYQKPGAVGAYAQYAENDILEYAYHNWYGSDRMMLMGILDWYGDFSKDAPSASISNITWNAGTATLTYPADAAIPPAKVGDTIYLSDVYTYAEFYGYLDGTTLTVTEMVSGVIVPRDDWKGQIFNCGINVNNLAQPSVFQQISGTPGGVGVYQTNGNPQTAGSPGSPCLITHRNVLYDGQHTVTGASGTTLEFAQSVDPGSFGQGSIATAPTCPAGGTYLFCRRLGNHPTRIAYAPVGTNWNNWTKVSQLWVPGDETNGKHGFIETYVNGVPVTRVDWIPDVTEGGNPLIPHVYGVQDRVNMYLHLEAGAGYPIDVNYVRVWQRQ